MMRWSKGLLSRRNSAQQARRVVPDSTAATSAEARDEARKGTAAADPVIGITPEGQVLPGAVVDGEFVEAEEHVLGTAAPDAHEHDDERVASGEIPGENERNKHAWWVNRGARSGEE